MYLKFFSSFFLMGIIEYYDLYQINFQMSPFYYFMIFHLDELNLYFSNVDYFFCQLPQISNLEKYNNLYYYYVKPSRLG